MDELSPLEQNHQKNYLFIYLFIKNFTPPMPCLLVDSRRGNVGSVSLFVVCR